MDKHSPLTLREGLKEYYALNPHVTDPETQPSDFALSGCITSGKPGKTWKSQGKKFFWKSQGKVREFFIFSGNFQVLVRISYMNRKNCLKYFFRIKYCEKYFATLEYKMHFKETYMY